MIVKHIEPKYALTDKDISKFKTISQSIYDDGNKIEIYHSTELSASCPICKKRDSIDL